MAEASWCLVAAGSNIEPAVNLPAALERLRERVVVERISSVVETAPVDAPGTPDFMNAAVLIDIELSPGNLKLEVLRPIEAALGRRRGADPNAPRPIDLDVVLWAGGPLEDRQQGLHLPDPGLTEFAHLAVPASELLPEWVDPRTGLSLSEIARGFSNTYRRVELEGWGPVSRSSATAS